jgi:hypothetical protein
MTDEELVKRLRKRQEFESIDGYKRIEWKDEDALEAADRIEALTKELDEANKRGDAWRFRAGRAEVKLVKAMEALRWSKLNQRDARAIIAEIEGE